MNYLIQLNENGVQGLISSLFVVTPNQLKEVQKMENFGGFKRFYIDIYKETNELMNMESLRVYKRFLKDIGI